MKNNVKSILSLVKNIFRNASLEKPVIIFIAVSIYFGYTFFSFSEIAANFSGIKISSLSDLYEKFYIAFFLFYFNNLIYLAIIIFLSTMFLYSKAYRMFKKFPISTKNSFMMSLFVVMLCIYVLIVPSVVFNIVVISSDMLTFMVIMIVLAIFYFAFVLCYVGIMQLVFQYFQLVIKKVFGKVYFWAIAFLAISPFIALIIYKHKLRSIEQIPVIVFLVIHLIAMVLWYKSANICIMFPVKSSKVSLNIDKIKTLPASILNTLLLIIRNRADFILSLMVIVFYFIFSSSSIALFDKNEFLYMIIPFLLMALGMMNVYLVWYRRISKKLYHNTNIVLILLVTIATALLALLAKISVHYCVSLVMCIATILKFKLVYDPDKISSLSFMLVLSMITMILLGVFYVFNI